MDKEKRLIGAHTSASGGVYHALLEGRDIGATTIQLFTANQRRWDTKPLSEEVIVKWRETLKETNLEKIMSHDSYLINLGAPDPEKLQKSVTAFRKEADRCVKLGISYLNFHPGAALDDSEQACLERIVESIKNVEDIVSGSSLRLLIETTAGQGSNVGYRFEHLSYIIERVKDVVPIGVCIDTCHIFAAGYDIRDKASWDRTLEEFDRTVGLKHLYAFHINDSMKPFGSRKDRHAPLGEGEIGIECFQVMMNHPKIKHLPMYLETPGGPNLWKKEIKMLRGFIQ